MAQNNATKPNPSGTGATATNLLPQHHRMAEGKGLMPAPTGGKKTPA